MNIRSRLLVILGLAVVVALVAALVALRYVVGDPTAVSTRPAQPAATQPATRAVISSAHRALHPPPAAAPANPQHPPASTPAGKVLSQAGWAVTVHHVASGGRDRSYVLARPSVTGSAGAGTLPVVVVLHGRMMTPAAMMAQSGFLAEVGAAIVVFPAGYDRSWNVGYCCGGAQAAGVDDVAFLRAVVAQVLAQQPGASASRIYLAGFSNGGRMAYRMACDAPGLFAGVAAVEAVSVSECSQTTPVPLLIVAQTGDPLLTIDAGARPKHIAGHAETTVQAEVATWRGLDGCGAAQSTATLGDLTTQSWNQCRGQGRVEEAIYGGGGHNWFRGCQATPSAQDLVWSFFQARPPTVTAGGPACGHREHTSVA